MPPLLTASQMQEFDRLACQHPAVSPAVLMENAGQQAAAYITRTYPRSSRVFCFCGSGNNGGDGYVTARHLARAGFRVRAYSVGDLSRESELARRNREYLIAYTGDPVLAWREARLEAADLVVDAVLGIGARGEPRPALKELLIALAQAREAGLKIIALDLPSGLDLEASGPLPAWLGVDATISFGYPKFGTQTPAARRACGRIILSDIFFPDGLIERVEVRREWYTAREARDDLPPRPSEGYKKTLGRVLVIAGSKRYPGAASLAVLGALASGAGLVTLALPASLVGPSLSPEVILNPIEDQGRGCFFPEALDQLEASIMRADALVLGPGLGEAPEALEFVARILAMDLANLVLDADALKGLAGYSGRFSRNLVLTPHLGEFKRILGREPLSDLEREVLDYAQARGLTLALKGASNLVAEPSGWASWITSGHPILARGGSGDLLAGLIGGLLARGLAPRQAASLGVWLHGAAGQRLAARGQESLRLGELADEIPRVMAELAREWFRLTGEPELFNQNGECDGSKT